MAKQFESIGVEVLRGKTKQFPPPFGKLTPELIERIKEHYFVKENPNVRPCPHCGMEYDDFKTGLDYQEVFDMLWSGSSNPDEWVHKGRHQVLGKWYQIKRDMFDEHILLCGRPQEQADWLEDWEDQDFEY